ncbi:MAG: TrmH family RNA methyltransferase [Candidatus Zambryskibacteria bacterium]
MEIIVILNNIRSNENVGSIFRTADATGVSKIILCGYTPTPIDRFGRENKGLTKASLGAEKFVEWEKFENLKEAIKKLKSSSVRSQMLRISRFQKSFSAPKVVAVEQDKRAIDYRKLKNYYLKSKNYNLALVFGNEVEGLSKEDLKLCDIIAELPMRGSKESLNVAVCAGVVLYSLI